MKTKLLTEADLKEDGKYQRFMVWDEANERLTYWDAELGMWGRGAPHPHHGTWIEHRTSRLLPMHGCPISPDVRRSSYRSPDRFPDGFEECNPKGVAEANPSLYWMRSIRQMRYRGKVEVTLKG